MAATTAEAACLSDCSHLRTLSGCFADSRPLKEEQRGSLGDQEVLAEQPRSQKHALGKPIDLGQ